MTQLQFVRVNSIKPLPTPRQLKEKYKITDKAQQTVVLGRKTIEDIIEGRDKRKILVVGPCSIHNIEQALDYAKRLKNLADEIQDQFYPVIRIYFEKPRSTVGWKGLIMDPDLDGSGNVEKGLNLARKLLLEINELGLPVATELLYPDLVLCFSDLVSWYAIGARTTEAQTHREVASGVSAPVGFKNGTNGDIKIATNAMHSAANSHTFVGPNDDGILSCIKTKGNPYTHIILRGSEKDTNYEAKSVMFVKQAIELAGLQPRIMIDCSHGNSSKDYRKQAPVFLDILGQIIADRENTPIIGMMLESHINEGNQPLKDPQELKYGISITDACISWETTQELILEAYRLLKNV
jgi:3-deoxy-7-phosphoheptulonate synthase